MAYCEVILCLVRFQHSAMLVRSSFIPVTFFGFHFRLSARVRGQCKKLKNLSYCFRVHFELRAPIVSRATQWR